MGEVSLHKPVLIDDILRLCAPIQGEWLDGTFGAGGYTRALIDAGARHVLAIDRDPYAHQLAEDWISEFEGQIDLKHARFSQMETFAEPETLDGVVLDIGVSSMQLDEPERGFSFMKDGPLDMRMSSEGPTAADLVNSLSETELADTLYLYGEERKSRRVARAIVAKRKEQYFERTLELAQVIEGALPRKASQDIHPATRSFQALRIAVNGEMDELKSALKASVSLLKPNGYLVVVSFHSLEDRMVKRFFAETSGKNQSVNRHQPVPDNWESPVLKIVTKRPVTASEAELENNSRARSAKLRIAQKLEAVS